VWLGLSDWDHNQWRWINVAGEYTLDLAELASHTADDGDLFAVLLLAGVGPASLEYLRFGGNLSPIPALISDVASGDAPLGVTFYALDSFDYDGVIGNYQWDLDGDGTFNEPGLEEDALGLDSALFIYDSGGSYQPTLVMTDDQGADTIVSIPISVNDPPLASLSATPGSGIEPLSVQFDGTGSSDPDGSITDYEWDLDGNGAYNDPGPEADARGLATAEFEYTAAGQHTARLRVSDDTGSAATDLTVIDVGGWLIETVDNTGDPGWWNSLVLDSTGLPRIGYHAARRRHAGAALRFT
jgi:hypothetical protein